MSWKRRLLAVLALCLMLVLQGCTGGGGGGGGGGNKPPQIISYIPDQKNLNKLPGAEVDFSITATDPDGDSLSYDWTTTGGGTITPNGNTAKWKAPQQTGSATVKVTVADGKGGVVSHTWNITIGAVGNVIYVREDINAPKIWESGNIYVIDADYITVRSKLTIEEGVIVKFREDARLEVEGSGRIEAVGSASNRIIFTSLRDDYGGNTDGRADTPEAGDWGRVCLGSTNGNRFEYCSFVFGGGVENSGMLDLGQTSNTVVQNCIFTLSETVGLWAADATKPTIQSNIFYGNQKPLVISVDTSLDDSNIFHNPLDPSQENAYQGIFVTPDSKHGYFFARDITWAETEVAFVLYDWHFEINPSAKLTLAPGVTMKFDHDTRLYVYGRLEANGQQGKPIVFTSYFDSEYGGDSAGSDSVEPQAGDWDCVYVGVNGQAVFEHCLVRYGGSATDVPGGNTYDVGAIFDDAYSRGTEVTNTIFEYNERGLDMRSPSSTVRSSEFRNNTYPLWTSFDIDTDNSLTIEGNTYNAIYLGYDWSLHRTEVKWQHNNNPYVILESPYLTGVTVTIGQGSVFRCWQYVVISISEGGGFYRYGYDPFDSAIFTSYRDTAHGGDVGGGYGPAKGDWEGIEEDGEWISHPNILYAKNP